MILYRLSSGVARALTALAMACLFAAGLPVPAHAASTTPAARPAQWRRSMLVYHDPNRTSAQWQRHLMRVAPDGGFTGQWLFDGAILTAVSYNGKDLMYGGLTGPELSGLLDQLFSDAAQLDDAAATLAARYGGPKAPIQVSIAVPWLSPSTTSLTLPGASTPLNLSVPAQRVQAVDWYLDQIKSRAAAAKWRDLTLYGAYYQREEIIDEYGDSAFATRFNADAHARGMKTVWVPYYGAPHMWDAASLGFDVSNVQPSVAFRGAQYEGVSDQGTLYAVGQNSRGHKQAFEYESSTAGESPPENWTSHQYLAVEQYFGTDAYPQVFFAGLTGDMFDVMTTQAAAVGDRWWCYDDLANYLAGQKIANLEIGLPWPAEDMPDGTRQVVWSAPPNQQLWALRLDLLDDDASNPWRGRLTVRVDGPGGTRTSFAQRTAKAGSEPYQSLSVPLALSARGTATSPSSPSRSAVRLAARGPTSSASWRSSTSCPPSPTARRTKPPRLPIPCRLARTPTARRPTPASPRAS